jgi:sodium-dependent dicarboxylate transporter 2/3/5
MLPVATPPNAVVFGSGQLQIKDMVYAGILLNLIGAVVITVFIVYLMPIMWGVDLSTIPPEAIEFMEQRAAELAK